MDGGEGKPWRGKKKSLSRNQHGKNSGYIRWQAAKVVDGGRGRANEQSTKLLLLFFFGSNFAFH